MAQFDTNKQVLNRNNNVLYEVQMQADQYGNIISPAATAKSAFGEPISVPVTPVLQLDGLYGLPTRQFESFVGAAGGTVGSTGTLMQVTTGTNIGGYGVLRSRRAVRYRPGQGALARFTARFTATDGVGVAGYTQRAGFFTQEQALQIGFDGEQFGVLRQNGGKAHIEELVVSAGATVDGNITITLDGFGVVVAVLNGDSITDVIQKIVTAFASVGSWIVEYTDTKVCFLSTSVGPKAGAFSFTAGGTGVAATTSTLQSGVADTTTWVYQNDFNIDKLDGTGPSGAVLDPSKLNVFQINFRWLGAGELRFAIENPINGDMIFFHHIHFSNQNTDVHIDNPSMKIGYVAASLGGSGTNVVVEGASMLGAIEGLIDTTTYPVAHARQSVALTQNVLRHVFSIKNRLLFDNKINLREVLVKKLSAGITSQSFSFGSIYLFLNATNSIPHIWEQISPESQTYYSDVDGVITLANEIPLASFTLAKDSPEIIDLEDLRIVIPPNNTVSVAIRTAGQASLSADASLVWIED